MPFRRPSALKPTHEVSPMQLCVCDRFADEEGGWEVVAHPFTHRGGKSVEARARRVDQLASEPQRFWPAHRKLTVRRAPE